jgi:hypothetical protein
MEKSDMSRRKKFRHQLYVLTDYFDEVFGHRPYMGMLHGEDDQPTRADVVLERAVHLAGARDGDEIMVVVLKTGRRPFGRRRVRYVEPHKYEREPSVVKSRSGTKRTP